MKTVRRLIAATALLLLGACADRYMSIGARLDVNAERARLAKRMLAGTGGSKRALVFVYHNPNDLDWQYDPKTLPILRDFYVVRTIRISADYYEKEDLMYYSDNRKSLDCSFDYYLLTRNYPFTPADIKVLRELGIDQTPTYLVLDESGNLITTSNILTTETIKKYAVK